MQVFSHMCARIAEVLEPGKESIQGPFRKGPFRSIQERNEQRRHISRGPEGWWPTGKFLFFLGNFIQKRKRLKHQKTFWRSYNLSVFATLHSYCQCPWPSINCFLVKGNHLAFLPTLRYGAPADSNLVGILLSYSDLVRLWLLVPNICGR
jgi:hypothetical protein